VAAGRAAGLATVAVTWGVFSPAALAAAAPDFTVTTPGELADLCLDGQARAADVSDSPEASPGDPPGVPPGDPHEARP